MGTLKFNTVDPPLDIFKLDTTTLVDPSGPTISQTPSLCVINSDLYIAHQRGAESGAVRVMMSYDGVGWQSPIVPAFIRIKISGSPTLAFFDSKTVFLVHQGGGDSGTINWTTWLPGNTINWADDQKMADFGMTDTPALIEFNQTLYCLHQGFKQNGSLYYTTFEGPGWSQDQRIKEIGMSWSPALAVYKNRLYAFYNGFKQTNTIWYTSTADGQTWDNDHEISDLKLTGSPAAVVYRDKLWLFHQGEQNSGDLWCKTYDGTDWDDTKDRLIAANVMTHSPSVAVYNDMIYVMYQGAGNSQQIDGYMLSEPKPA